MKLAATSASGTIAELTVLVRIFVDNEDTLTVGSLKPTTPKQNEAWHHDHYFNDFLTKDPMFKTHAKD